MRKKSTVYLLVGLLLLFALSLSAENNYAASYMKMGLGAKAMGMGGTGTAFINNVTAAYWNPAGLSRLKQYEFTSMYTNFQDNSDWGRNFYYASFGMKFKAGCIAVTWVNASVNDIMGYTSTIIVIITKFIITTL